MKKRDFIKTLTVSAAGVTIFGSLTRCSLFRDEKRLPENWVWITAGKQTDGEWGEIFRKMEKGNRKGLLIRG